MAARFVRRENETLEPLVAYVVDSRGVPLALNLATERRVLLRPEGSSVWTVDRTVAAVPITLPSGTVVQGYQVDWVLPEPGPEGDYEHYLKVTWPGIPTPQTYPTDGHTMVTITPAV